MSAVLKLLCFLFLAAANWAATATAAQDAEENTSTRGDENPGLLGLVVKQAVQLHELSEQVQSLQNQVSLMQGVQERNSASIGVALNASSHPKKQVAFTAKFSDEGLFKSYNVGSGGTLKYDTIVTNMGDGYEPLTGHFDAPFPGLYAFFASVRRTGNRHNKITLGIYKDDELLVIFHSESHADPWEYGVAFATTHLRKGESVYVKRYTPHSGDTFVEAGPYTTFSGMLVAAD